MLIVDVSDVLFSRDQRSLALYINRHASSNAKTEDLWAALEEGSGQPVNKLMNSWTRQKGYPVVSIRINDQKLEFEQVFLSMISLALVHVQQLYCFLFGFKMFESLLRSYVEML